ncbi:hypothetical protein MKQ70_21430 [Chitinophaga sedimenti]|uniref:MOFRL family protein n=1 Tax=Chitinophaga sedimenti TaxID=2033606 RepID=UPI002002F8B2|nr:MOFRL family protein [Chitinophaga sedimenti]MCK7557426.1 hypothetical protein [Chitinophaga sedimenti]
MGYHAHILTAAATGSTETLSSELLRTAMEYNGPLPACLLMGGESTVIVKGTGKGGRNQQFALQAGLKLRQPNITILSGGTDGTDGPTDAAGAMVNMEIMNEAAAMGKNAREALSNNDAYTFFDGTKGLIRTGPTQTNVMDIMLALITDR